MINNYCLEKKNGGAEARGGERSSGEKVVVRETRSTMEGYNNQLSVVSGQMEGKSKGITPEASRRQVGGKFEKEQAATVTNRFSKTGASSMTSKGRGRHNHINGWFDFGSTLGRVLTGKTLKTLVAAITLVLMVLGAGNALGQSRIGAQRDWSSNNATTGVPTGNHYTLTSDDCSNGDYYEFRDNSNQDYDKWVWFSAPEGCRIKITLTSNGLNYTWQGGAWNGRYVYDYIFMKDGNSQPDPNGGNPGGYNFFFQNGDDNGISYVSSEGQNQVAIRFNNGTNSNSTFTFKVECFCVDEGINMGNGSKNIDCGPIYGFFDRNGASGFYGNNENYTYTFTSGGDIHIKFESFLTENATNQDRDNIKIYDGDVATGTKYVFGCTGWNNGFNGAAAGFNNILTTGTTYTCTSGTMTIVWKSNRDNNAAGWIAKVWATGCCEDWTSESLSFRDDHVDLVIGDTYTNVLSGSVSPTPTTGGTYSSSNPTNLQVTNNTTGALRANAPGTYTITYTIPEQTISGHTYCKIEKTYTVTVECADVAITSAGRTCEMIDGVCYLNACAEAGGHITLTADPGDLPNPRYTWVWNAHNGGRDTTATTQSVNISTATQRGVDVTLTISSSNGCSIEKKARIRVGGGIDVVGVIADLDLGHICVGTTGQLIIGEGDGSAIQISQAPVNISAVMGSNARTFIPDGVCNGTRCYESVVEFTGFDAGAKITSANDIEYVKINLEHSFIGDLHISIECPNGQDAIILQDADIGFAGAISQDAATYDWFNTTTTGGWNSTTYYHPITFGTPNWTDADPENGGDICDTNQNRPGTGATYIWSNATTLGYQYANGPNGYRYVYREDNCTYVDNNRVATYRVNPSIEGSPLRNVYNPYQNFYNELNNCPLNGEWKIKVCDRSGTDNGWIFSWSLGLSHDLIPTPWGFEDTVVSRSLACGADIHTYQHGDTLFVAPRWGDNASSCHVVLTDNLGCEQEISNTITFILDSAWINLKSGNPVQQFCEGSTMASPIEYAYGGMKHRRAEFKEYEYS
jgi:subtilisin-like proprotein convertase family protein